jgi:hypothetical protein
MLEQRAFVDAHGVTWLNRPGPARGIPARVIVLFSLIPGQIIRLGVSASWRMGVLISIGIAALLFLVGLIVHLLWSCQQTCPHCHTTKLKGYKRCSGCGYPCSWSPPSPAAKRRQSRQK